MGLFDGLFRKRKIIDAQILQALEGKNSDVRESVAEALKMIKDKRAVKRLSLALEDEDVVVYVAEALGRIGDKRAVKPLIQSLKDEEKPGTQTAVAEALGMIGDKRAVKHLIQALKGESVADRSEPVCVLEKIVNQPIEPFIQGLKVCVRERAAWALGEIGDEKAVEALNHALKDEDIDIQKAAREALEKIKAKKSRK